MIPAGNSATNAPPSESLWRGYCLLRISVSPNVFLMPDAAETALKKLSGWVDVTVNAAIKKDEMLITRVFYEGAPAFIRCVGGEMTMSVIHPRDFWAVDLGALEGHGG